MLKWNVPTRWIRATAGLAFLLAVIVLPIGRPGAVEGRFGRARVNRIDVRLRHARPSHLALRCINVLRYRLKALRSSEVEELGDATDAFRELVDLRRSATFANRHATPFHPALVTPPLRC